MALIAARRRKERRHPELVGRRARARVVVLAVEVGGRWSSETLNFLSHLAKAKAGDQNWLLRRRAEMAWRARWASLLACTVARAVASSFLELPQASGADGETPALHEVERDLEVSSVELPGNCVRLLDFWFGDFVLFIPHRLKKKEA